MRTLMVLAAVFVSAPADAQVVREMTPELIRDAITAGESGASGPGALWSSDRTVLCGYFTTPFSRVAIASSAAKEEYRKLQPGEVTDDMVDPHAFIHATANPTSKMTDVRTVKMVVVAPIDSDDIAAVIRPVSSSTEPKTYTNSFGATTTGVSLSAKFPLSVLKAGNEVRVVYEDAPECRAKIDADDLR